jgi:NADH dehydrogenase
MKIAITGGTGFVGRHLANRLAAEGHEVVAIGRRARPADLDSRVMVVGADVLDRQALTDAFAGCEAVAHCAGINREIGSQTYAAVHVRGTQGVVDAAKSAGVQRIAMVSFLRARPDGPTEYHRSKWQAEEIVRDSGLTWTILKSGVIYGRGDHMLDHLSHAFYTFPIFGLVGLHDRPVRPVAVDDVCRVLEAAMTGDPRLADRTVAVLGPDELQLGEAVRRVAAVAGRRPLFIKLPVAIQLVIAHAAELTMRVPLLAVAQAHILAEGVVDPLPNAEPLPPDLYPRTPFSEDAIRRGLPDPGGFGRADLRWCTRG